LDGASMLKLSGAWLCGLSSVPQGSGLSRLRSSLSPRPLAKELEGKRLNLGK
jgi:hypothetical protein